MRISATLALAACLVAACATKPKPESDTERDALHKETQAAIKDFKANNAKIGDFFKNAHAYAVFPKWMWRSMQGSGHLDGLERKVLWEHASNVLARLREQRE